MKKLAILPLCLGCVFAVTNSHAIDLKQSKFTQVVNDVQIISATDQQQKNASVNDVFSMPDILRTGIASRAELVAADDTVTRVGANTIFSFDPASRTIDLKQGSLLFHSPHGKGGGTIHTGSATASVLGTTLIVTTTPSGGMKVLDLEGSVEVKFLNGLKQNLAPGHMTFVLPGGNQLAPIIVFRLDALTKQSLLVSGFHQNLASMPLIQQQINKQLKLLQNGKLTDSGLEVGGDASVDKVQVIDVKTLAAALDNSYRNSRQVQAALAYDAYINQSSLIASGIPTPPARVFLNGPPPKTGSAYISINQPVLLLGNTFFAGQPFEGGFFGNNIYFNTVGANPLLVDLTPYASLPEFDMVAAGNLTLAGSVYFSGLSRSASIVFSLVAGNQIIVAPGATIEAEVANFDWEAAGSLTLNNAGVLNSDVGNTAFELGGDFIMENNAYIRTYANLSVRATGNITISHSMLTADSIIMNSALGTMGIDSTVASMNSFGIFTSKQTLTVNNSSFYANANSGGLSFNSIAGSVNISGTYLQAQLLNVSAGDSISLDGTGQTFASGGSGSTASFTAANLAAFNNADLTSFGKVNITANTINLHNMKFSGIVDLASSIGQWYNVGSGSGQNGFVNNYGGNTWDGNALNAANGFHGTIAGTTVTISTR